MKPTIVGDRAFRLQRTDIGMRREEGQPGALEGQALGRNDLPFESGALSCLDRQRVVTGRNKIRFAVVFDPQEFPIRVVIENIQVPGIAVSPCGVVLCHDVESPDIRQECVPAPCRQRNHPGALLPGVAGFVGGFLVQEAGLGGEPRS